MDKILDRETLRTKLNELRNQGKKIAFTNGCFDILHVGHVRYLREARKTGDVLVLALNSDSSVRALKGEKRPLVSEQERAEVLAALEFIDYVTIFPELTPLELINFLKPDVLIKGGDWPEEKVVGREEIKQWGGRVAIIPEVEGKSTTNVIEKIIKAYCSDKESN
ncbi:MAG TPA: D-glycero-beta-D-manno-heptose 1-phosphate adenylyltransferase [Smithella sp.]|nr:D-glycero-beta-D-manno-heptose 1-phosphate adenylyltransferase [Smithella sp.]MDM7987778.1 D-glycero-beta-D-manno-heptose 1-phosphate adenylyltransferase [Smithella sp.]HNY49643.1 D-glycero-beta-D-manno-heptose 1-phosphate adenylyltransferase [Smithella sp.]HOG90626.1 D-glycero-beta-D-manno-heptose 1-phosphate adenylyltransferase [Smithella sp.]HOU51405.1 D-glycero-beta-D-manno-heptose 1-phosphate adenylyltransferase [Smithella sp.]